MIGAQTFNDKMLTDETRANIIASLVVSFFGIYLKATTLHILQWTVSWHFVGTPADASQLFYTISGLIVALRVAYGANNAMRLSMRQNAEMERQTGIQQQQLDIARESLLWMQQHPGGDVHLTLFGGRNR